MGTVKRDQFEWTEERQRTLKAFWKEGKSGKFIGDYFGISRNAVIGKAHRLNLDRRPNPIKRSVELKVKAPRVRGEKVMFLEPPKCAIQPEPVEPEPLAESRNLLLHELRNGECKFPATPFKAPIHRFCGAPAMSNGEGHKSYCYHHEMLTHQPRKEAAE